MSNKLHALQDRLAIARVEMFQELRPKRSLREVDDDVFEYRDLQITRAGRKYNPWARLQHVRRRCWTVRPLTPIARKFWGDRSGPGGAGRWPTVRGAIDAIWTQLKSEKRTGEAE